MFNQSPTHNLDGIDEKILNTFNNDSLNQRRQSLSARYLMKTQLPTNCTSTLNTEVDKTINIDKEPILNRTEIISSQLSNLSNKNLNPNILASINCIFRTNDSLCLNNNFSCIIASSNTLSAQMTADLLKIKKNKTNNYLQSTSLHFHHTESSLNKVKSKQMQPQILAENLKLNKSPSMSSVFSTLESNNEGDQKPVEILNLVDDKVLDNTAIIINSKNKQSPSKVFTQINFKNDKIAKDTNTETNEKENSLNLKKASSMVSLNSITQAAITSSLSFNSRPICPVNGSKANTLNNGFTQLNRIISNNATTNNNLVILHVNQVVTNNLPPKTVR